MEVYVIVRYVNCVIFKHLRSGPSFVTFSALAVDAEGGWSRAECCVQVIETFSACVPFWQSKKVFSLGQKNELGTY